MSQTAFREILSAFHFCRTAFGFANMLLLCFQAFLKQIVSAFILGSTGFIAFQIRLPFNEWL